MFCSLGDIRDARAGDAEAVACLLGQLGYPTSGAVASDRLARLAASGADHVLVAVLNGEAIGLATVHTSLTIVDDESAAKLSAIVVDERYRRAGIGEALVSAAEDRARAAGCSLMFLTTAERRTDAHAFYRQLGFEETGRRFAKSLR
jgi:GNAT superfamily N-acetyltransferase